MSKLGFTLCMLIALAAGFSVARATEQTVVTFDGVWWSGLAYSEKVIAVQAMIVGYGAGYNDGAQNSVDKVFVPIPSPPPGIKLDHPFPPGAEMLVTTSHGKVQLARAMNLNRAGVDRDFATMVDEFDRHFIGHQDRQKEMVQLDVSCAITSGLHCAR